MAQDQMFTGIDRRIALDREEGDIAYFNALMLKLEYLTKVVVAGVVACISDDIDRHRYCSRVAWLHLNVGNQDRALDIARIGLKKEPDNTYCLGLIERLEY